MSRTLQQQAAYDKIGRLVEHFASQVEVFKKNQNEDETRIQFINPLFDALGWDMYNTKRKAIDSDRDVVHEDRLKIEGKSKAPDYSFRIGGKRKFFLEAKKPSIKIETDILPSYQLRRYGWNDPEVHVSILTDFEEFALYDCTIQPKQNDPANFGRHKYITYDQYLEKFDCLWEFSKEQVLKGSLDQFAKSDKKGTQSVDAAFLQSLDEWRNLLATNIAIRNKQLNEDEINYIVQMNINRIVFIRNCEDRGAEPYGKLKGCLFNAKDEGGYFRNMYRVFEDADRKYNSGIFDFTKDSLSKSVVVDNDVVSTIVDELYFPKSPYEFSVIGVEILGTAYERFLGKVIRLTQDHQAVVEEKPEVRKAGGVFYTPQYIVEYIVKNTVGKLIEGKTPGEIEKIKICDPACGSGSFLLGAYQYLLNYHTDWYNKNYKKSRNLKDSPLTPDGRLTTHLKKQILLNNIFGVDIDAQAVEVTKLSLLMKCLEGETVVSMQTTLTFERVLPTLDNNIKSGNSLIDFDFYEGQLDFGEDKKIKPFNWKQAFPQVFKQGGFDVVIGNPPYRTLQLGKGQESIDDEMLTYYERKYKNSYQYKINLYSLFIERSLVLLKSKGVFSFIVPNTFYNTNSFSQTRKYLIEQGAFSLIADLRYKVFEDAEIGGNAVFVYCKEGSQKDATLIIVKNIEEFKDPIENTISTSAIKSDSEYNLIQNLGATKILSKIKSKPNVTELGSIIKIYQGIITGDNKKYLSDKEISSMWKPILKGRDINKYSTNFNNNYVYYSPDDLWSNTDEKMFKVAKKIISRQTSDKLIATLDTKGYFSLDSTHVIHLLSIAISIEYLLGVFNSKLLNFIYQSRVQEGGRVFAQVKTVNLKPLPIVIPEPKDKNRHDEIVKNVELLLKLNTDLQTETNTAKKEQMQGMIAYAEQRINEIVYELYELTPEEIKIVEGDS